MFVRARRRLTVAYIVMFALALVAFSVVFMVLVAIALEPDFDLAPETASDEVAQIAYDAAVQRIGMALAVADILAITVVGVGAWMLAARTMSPIRAAHERQRRFVADASHEMRTPLTAIRATTDNALREGTSPAQMSAALGIVADASAELTALTSDLLTLAQSDDVALPATERFDLSVAVAERLALRAAARARAPSSTSFGTDLLVRGSQDDIGRICDNLIDNAFRHGGAQVRVSVTTKAADRHAVLEVADDGPGIAQADQEHVFEAFYRIRSDAAAPTGTGLGLAIASALAKRNRGRLTVTSTLGQGATFRLDLPLAS